jgi:hypothetical protein
LNPVARAPLVGFVLKRLARLRFPWLFAIAGALLAADLITPDPIPFLDELTLGAIAVLLGSWRKPTSEDAPADPPSAAENPDE